MRFLVGNCFSLAIVQLPVLLCTYFLIFFLVPGFLKALFGYLVRCFFWLMLICCVREILFNVLILADQLW